MNQNMCEKSVLTDNQHTLLKHQLQFFFLINPDVIVKDILQDLHDTVPENSVVLFDTIFKHVFAGAAPYCDFLSPNTYNSFFGERDSDHPLTKGLRHLMFTTLQNSCVFRSYIQYLAKASSPISISAKNEAIIFHSAREMIFPPTQTYKKERGSTPSQFWNNRKNIYKKAFAEESLTYAFKIVKGLNLTQQEESNHFPLTALQYQAPLIAFLFAKDSCVKFSRLLTSEKSIQAPFERIWRDYKKQSDTFDYPIDKIIFGADIENVFGFCFFSSISKALESIHNSDPDKPKSLNKLEGSILADIIEQAANLPLPFNKALFFRYVCSIFTSSTNITRKFFEENASQVVSRLPDVISEELQTPLFFDLAKKFFLVVGSVTIPVLYALWDVVTCELNRNEPKFLITPEHYESYLSENYIAISSDYSCIPDQLIQAWEHSIIFGKCIDNQRISNYLSGLHDNKEESVIPDYLSSYPRQTILRLIRSYCDFEHLQKRAPFMFLSDYQLDNYSPLSPLIDSILIPEDTGEPKHSVAKKPRKLDQLELDHKYNLFNYLFSGL